MGLFSTHKIFGVKIRESATDGSDFSNPDADYRMLFLGEDGQLHLKDSAGTVTLVPVFVGVHAYHDTTQSINDSTWTALNFNQERFDYAAAPFHDLVTNNSRLTVPAGFGGRYLIGGMAQLAANATGLRMARIIKNGATVISHGGSFGTSASVGARVLPASTIVDLIATDYVELQVWQNSGGALNSENAADYAPQFWMRKVG